MNPILVEVYRGGVLESFHRGAICVTDKTGNVIWSRGDVHQLCYPRSAMKYLQVIPLLEDGALEFTNEEIAVMCGSHNGEPDHVRVVDSILKKSGLNRSHLKCGVQYPTYSPASDELKRAAKDAEQIHNNCSGKHAGMLALCVKKNWPVENYTDPQHPLQLAIRKVCSEYYEWEEQGMVTALDGCSAPIFSVPVIHQAIGYKNLVVKDKWDERRKRANQRVLEAITQYPFMVAGTKRYCTDMMRITAPLVIGKTGAEGIFCMAFSNQEVGVCIKIDDGKMLPQYHVAEGLLEASGLFSSEKLKPLTGYRQKELRNFNKLVTGEIKPAEGLFDDFPKLN